MESPFYANICDWLLGKLTGCPKAAINRGLLSEQTEMSRKKYSSAKLLISCDHKRNPDDYRINPDYSDLTVTKITENSE